MKTLKIEFEGTDGAGKTTGLTYFIEQAKHRGFTVVETREVGNPHIPECVKLREFVLNPDSGLSGEEMELVFSRMRFLNDSWFRNLTSKPEGLAPDLVVSDRGWFSHLAYTDHNVSSRFTHYLYDILVKPSTLLPDVVIYFAVSTDTALKRRQKRGTGMDVIEMKGVEFQEKVRSSFENHIDKSEENKEGITFYTINANESLDNVKTQLNHVLNEISRRTSTFDGF